MAAYHVDVVRAPPCLNTCPPTWSAPASTPSSVAALRIRGHVRMQREHEPVAARDLSQEPFDGVRVEAGRVHLHGGRQVDDLEGAAKSMAIGDRLRDSRRTPPAASIARRPGSRDRPRVRDGGVDRDVHDARPVEPEHDPALDGRRAEGRSCRFPAGTRTCGGSVRRHCTSTWIVTSSGTTSSSTEVTTGQAELMNQLTSQVTTSASNMRRARAGSIGSMRAWLPAGPPSTSAAFG